MSKASMLTQAAQHVSDPQLGNNSPRVFHQRHLAATPFEANLHVLAYIDHCMAEVSNSSVGT